jgi:hypothetical protein
MHGPLQRSGSTLFLVDRTAVPIRTGNQIAPLPLRFFPLADDPALSAYVDQLNRDERARCEAIYGAGR